MTINDNPNNSFALSLQPLVSHAVFRQEGWHVWCGAVAAAGGRYFLLFSRWPTTGKRGFESWVTDSEICCAVGDAPNGPFEFVSKLWNSQPGDWDAVAHNPTVILADGTYYLFYMGTHPPTANAGWWDYRNAQRIGVAVADHPTGPWTRFDQPLLEVSAGSWADLACSNPTCTRGPDGKFYLIYKGIGSDGPMPKGGGVHLGLAVADNPRGPFRKHPAPILSHPTEKWSFEDPFLWHDGEYFRLLAKDFSGKSCGGNAGHCSMARSIDAKSWEFSSDQPAFPLSIRMEGEAAQPVERLERPFLFFEDGKPRCLVLACKPLDPVSESFNVQFMIDGGSIF